MYIDQLNNLLNNYAVENGLGKFSPSKQGTYRLTFQDNLVVNIDALSNAGVILIYANVGTVPSHARDEVCRALLKANFPGYETRHNTLALNEQQDTVLLLKSLSGENVGLKTFKKSMDDFISALNVWRRKVFDGNLVSEDEKGESEVSSSRFIRG